jgi:hypothetical protein
MTPRVASDYDDRQVEAARRVLIDLGQVLGEFRDCIVVIGGWVPDLLLPEAEEAHIGSIDVDLALDAVQLRDGRYAELLKLLLDTQRYHQGRQPFQMVTTVKLEDSGPPISVDIDFLAPKDVKLKSSKLKTIDNFRVLQAEACGTAFRAPEVIEIEGAMISGALNRVEVRVAAIPDFLLMKCFALKNREKPKDAYDIVYCLEHVAGGSEVIVAAWHAPAVAKFAGRATAILQDKFQAVGSFGPQQVAAFHNSTTAEERAGHAREAFERVQRFLAQLARPPETS